MDWELCPLFLTECFAKVGNDFELLTIFAERFVLHDWWSSESACTHRNLLVFYGYLLLLLLLYLYVVAISCLFELITITLVQHSTELCTEVVVLTLRGKLISLLLAFFMSMIFLCWDHLIDLRCKFDDWFLCGVDVGMERLSIYLYYLVFINMLSFNGRFAMFLLRNVLESNQVLTDVFKNVKI